MGPKDLPTSVTFGSPREALDRGMKNIGSSSLAPTGLSKHAPRRYKLGSTGSSATGLSPTHFDRLAVRYLATVRIAALAEWLR